MINLISAVNSVHFLCLPKENPSASSGQAKPNERALFLPRECLWQKVFFEGFFTKDLQNRP
jgi:hypothetical protein